MQMSKDHFWISSKEGDSTEMPEDKTKTQKSDWTDWKKTCAYLNCSPESQSRLGDFGVSRMLKWLGRVEGMTKMFYASEDCKKEAWQWLDVHIIQKDSRGGTRIGGAKEAKASKDWLFDSEGLLTVEDIEKYFTQGFFRAAAQEYARSNRSSSISLDQPISNSQEGVTLGELLGDGSSEIGHQLDLSEFMKLLRKTTDEEFTKLKEISKVAILGSSLGISLDNELIKEITGKGKSALYDHVKRANLTVLNRIKSDENFKNYQLNDNSLALVINRSLEEIAHEWGKNPENSASVLFDLA